VRGFQLRQAHVTCPIRKALDAEVATASSCPANSSKTLREHPALTLVVAQEDSTMNRASRNSHDLAHYVGLNAALFALIFIALMVAGVI